MPWLGFDDHDRPYFLEARDLRPMTAPNLWFRGEVCLDGGTASVATWRTYAGHLRNFFSYLEAIAVEWDHIENGTLSEYAQAGAARGVSHATTNARLRTIGRFYAWATEEGLLRENPIKYKTVVVRPPPDATFSARTYSVLVPLASYERVGKRPVRWQTRENVRRFLNTITVWRDKLLAGLMYRTGLRRAEAVCLRLSDVPTAAEVIAQRDRVEVVSTLTGKGGRRRMIYWPTADLLELYDYITTERSPLMRRCGETHDFVFVDRTGKPLAVETLNAIFTRYSQQCGVKLTPHHLRHSYAIHSLRFWKALEAQRRDMAKPFQPEKVLQQRLGHANVVTTMVYMGLGEEDAAKEAYANAQLIDYLMGGEITHNECPEEAE